MARAILAMNAGSSSIKFAVSEVDDAAAPVRIAGGEIEGIGNAAHFVARDATGAVVGERRWDEHTAPGHEALVGDLLRWVDAHLGGDTLVAVAHRIVHGGQDFIEPVRLTDPIVTALDRLTPLAPLHQGHCLSPVRAIMALRPGLPQIACFDTAFDHTMPPLATRFSLPREYEARGVRRYGFHGLSYEHIARTLHATAPGLASGRVIVAHLGNGASLCALRNGRSIDTTMGFTALDGLMTGTRCGTIDPGVVLYMLREQRLDANAIEDVLYRRSGLLGVSGISSDMRALIASTDVHAKDAIELFVYRIGREAAALVGALGGLDGLVFTAGIGEHVAEIRAAVCDRLAWLGVAVDPAANAHHANRISSPNSRVDVRVIPADEEAAMIRHALEALQPAPVRDHR